MSENERAFYKAVGKALQKCRRDASCTQETFAELLGVTRTTVTNMEAGRQGISLYQAAVIVEIFPAWRSAVTDKVP